MMPPRLGLSAVRLQPTPALLNATLSPPLLLGSLGYASFRQKKPPANTKPAKKARTNFIPTDLTQIDQFSLVEAMRYIRAMEVGHNPVQTKYELHVKLRTGKSGPTIKSRIRLPKPVKTDMRVAVIAEGKQIETALNAGATMAGTDELFDKIRAGEINFDKLICHIDSFPALTKSKLGRILGPKGLMPSQKFGTVVPNIAQAMKDLVGASDYRERLGVIRMAIGQLAFTELELQKNIKAFMEQLKKEFGAMSFRADKSVNEVVLSSTHSAGFSLSGEIRSQRDGAIVGEMSGEEGSVEEVPVKLFHGTTVEATVNL